MIATPDERNRLMQEVEGGDMCPTKERKSRWSGTGEMNRKQRRVDSLGPPSPDPWDLSR